MIVDIIGSMSSFVKPKALNKGDVVGIVAPSDAVEKKWVQQGVKKLKEWGLRVRLGKHLYSVVGDFAAGSADERKEDILRMIEDPEVKVIWAAEGGYAATEVLPIFTKEIVQKLRQNPKWFIGYSDVCVLLNALTSFKIVNIHGPNLTGLAEKDLKSQEWIRRMLFGETGMEIGSESAWTGIITGSAKGMLLTTNLDSLIAVLGTKFDPIMHGSGDIILGIEEWWIDKSTLQRQVDTIFNHQRADRIKGFILGRLIGIGEESYPLWGKKITPQQLIEGRVRLKGAIPMAELDDFGHPPEDNWLTERFPQLKKPVSFLGLPNGVNVQFTVESGTARLLFLENITAPVDE